MSCADLALYSINTLKLSPTSQLAATPDAAQLVSLLRLVGILLPDSGKCWFRAAKIVRLLTIDSSPNFPVLLEVLMGV
jgi:hypothetical protein